MTDPVGSALRRMRGGVLPVLDPASEQARRERIAARVVELAQELQGRRERRRRWGVGVAVAALVGACALALFLGVLRDPAPAVVAGAPTELRLVGGQASVRSAAGLSALGAGQLELPSDAVLVTHAEQSAELRLASETALSLAPASEVGVTRRQAAADAFEERVRLRSGSVALRVPKLGARGKVSVETRDALIEVHGTQFSVRVVERAPLEPFTEVQVREGRVLVRAGAEPRLLGAGERWSSAGEGSAASAPRGLEAPGPEAPASEPQRAEPSAAPSSASSAAPSRRAKPRRASASELAAQNRLLEAAELARKNGLPSLALARLEALIARYPDAELAHNARVERFRVLRLMGRERAARAAARAYLDQHPYGFARAEAEQLLAEPAP